MAYNETARRKEPYQAEIVTRCAPRWAWDIIDNALNLGTFERGPTINERIDTQGALQAMVDACESAA